MKLGSLVGGSATVIGPEATIADAAEALIQDGVGSLAVVEDHPDLRTAMRRERALKALPRERKLALIRRQQTGAGPHPDEEAHA